MKLLEYKIAWIDDQPDQTQGYRDRIASLLGRHGFELVIEWVSDKVNLDAFLDALNGRDDYDMIMVDWKLGQMVNEGSGGASVAHKIRARNSFATIIFYSAAAPGTLRAEIAKQLIDGVFCVNRTHFVEEATPLVKASVKRFSNFNAMRGLFLAAVAEFDDLIRGATFKAFKSIPEGYQQQVISQLLDGRIDYATTQVNKAREQTSPSDLTVIVKAIQPGSWELYQCLLTILNLASPSPKYSQAINTFMKYGEEVLTPRNDMAHLQEREKNGEKVLVRGDREWDAAKFDGLRHVLSDHYDNLKYIRECLVDELVTTLKVGSA